MNEVEKSVLKTESESEYDIAAKELLGHPIIVGQIIVAVLDDFKDIDPMEAIQYLIGKPHVNKVPMEPGFTNTYNSKTRKMELNTEDSAVHELLVRYDVIFYVNTPSGKIQIIVNLEAQKDEPKRYGIINRAIFYISRMISSQKGREFTDSDYDGIKRVYSIWLVMNVEKPDFYTLQLQGRHKLGNRIWRGDEGLMHIAILGLPRKPYRRDEKHTIHHFLTNMFCNRVSADDKLIMLQDYGMKADEKLQQEVSTMCNLSEAIKEEERLIGFVNSVRNTMESFHVPLQKAMDVMKVPENLRQQVKAAIEQ